MSVISFTDQKQFWHQCYVSERMDVAQGQLLSGGTLTDMHAPTQILHVACLRAQAELPKSVMQMAMNVRPFTVSFL